MPISKSEIEGVRISARKKIRDERGAVFHMLRNDDPEFERFGEIYFSTVFSGVVKGWHLHTEMTLNYLLVSGEIHLVLFAKGKLQEIRLSSKDDQSLLVTVPPGIWNGFKGIAKPESIVANCATVPHSPEEIQRINYNDPSVPFDWSKV